MKRFYMCSIIIGALLVMFLLPISSIASQANGDLKAKAEQSDLLVDINKAGADDLAVLPGVGPKIAQAIISYRSDHGPFKTVQELENVNGIGTKKMAKLKALVTVKEQE